MFASIYTGAPQAVFNDMYYDNISFEMALDNNIISAMNDVDAYVSELGPTPTGQSIMEGDPLLKLRSGIMNTLDRIGDSGIGTTLPFSLLPDSAPDPVSEGGFLDLLSGSAYGGELGISPALTVSGGESLARVNELENDYMNMGVAGVKDLFMQGIPMDAVLEEDALAFIDRLEDRGTSPQIIDTLTNALNEAKQSKKSLIQSETRGASIESPEYTAPIASQEGIMGGTAFPMQRRGMPIGGDDDRMSLDDAILSGPIGDPGITTQDLLDDFDFTANTDMAASDITSAKLTDDDEEQDPFEFSDVFEDLVNEPIEQTRDQAWFDLYGQLKGSATGRGRAVGQNIKYDIDALFPLMGESHSIVDTSGSDYKDFAKSYLQDSKAVRTSEQFKEQARYLRELGNITEGATVKGMGVRDGVIPQGANRLRFENLWEKYYNKGEGGTNANLSRVIALYNSPAGADFRTRNNIYNQVNSLQNDWVASGRSLESFARAFIEDLD